jgi:hypothetical protein
MLILVHARIAQLVERNLAKVEVAGSNPVSRSGLLEWWNGRHAGLKILWALARAGSSPASSTQKTRNFGFFYFTAHSLPFKPQKPL